MTRSLLVLLLASSSACGEDTLHQACTYTAAAFDIEEVSVLEDAAGWSGFHDAVVLDYDTRGLPEKATWRVSQVDLLVMIPASELASFPQRVPLTVELFDADYPDATRRYAATQFLDTSVLSWSSVALSNPTEAWELDQMRAWWSFDVTALVPETGMRSSRYLVGAQWPQSGTVITVGYSNYNRPCERNWTDFADGYGWQLNSSAGGLNDCNWPMLRVKVEVTDPEGNCAL